MITSNKKNLDISITLSSL